MKRISVYCLVLGFLTAQASAYMVHEEPEEETDETIRGKRQQNNVGVIGNVFNNIAIKTPVTSIGTETELMTNKFQEAISANKTEAAKLEMKYNLTTSSISDIKQRQRIEAKKLVESQREQLRIYEEQLRRRQFELVLQHNKRMQEQIVQEDKRPYSHIYRDPYGFNALTKWVVGSHGTFNGHTGHGDGHVYQFFNREKPLHFGGHRQRDNQSQQFPTPVKSALPLISTSTTTTTAMTTSTSSRTSITSTSTARPTRYYEVHEVVDEGINTFAWPNWFGIINALDKATYTRPDRVQNNIAPKKVKVKLNKLPPQNKIASRDQDDYKSKYAQARKNYNASEAELTGNEIDSDLESSEKRLTMIERGEQILLPNN
ncbi:PREDICTED: uncharacterized protein LOC105359449 [Ceratosolen solmsi marchali]|uniref:Uncharacterized protein LOC105359449 n=1 Tax=Ceratosolen solmsi marchali TaxID=326594 RepID=A0AAJ6VJG7_9HYME|nr:PREDICTED: uncharacterized protein LOC105359449 [Ceratosolen solmsi marchali]